MAIQGFKIFSRGIWPKDFDRLAPLRRSAFSAGNDEIVEQVIALLALGNNVVSVRAAARKPLCFQFGRAVEALPAIFGECSAKRIKRARNPVAATLDRIKRSLPMEPDEAQFVVRAAAHRVRRDELAKIRHAGLLISPR